MKDCIFPSQRDPGSFFGAAFYFHLGICLTWLLCVFLFYLESKGMRENCFRSVYASHPEARPGRLLLLSYRPLVGVSPSRANNFCDSRGASDTVREEGGGF